MIGKKKDKYIHIKNVLVWFGVVPLTTILCWYVITQGMKLVSLWLGT